jgi:signal transduction histidine kinase
MQNDAAGHRQEFYEVFMECIADLTEIPLGLYELSEGHLKELIPETSRANFEPHCKLIQTFPGGEGRCAADQLHRAKQALESDSPDHIAYCWAGVRNRRSPIVQDGERKSLVVYAVGQLDGPDKQALAQHAKAVAALGLNTGQAAQLRGALLQIKTTASLKGKLATLERLLPKLVRLTYGVMSGEKLAREIVERHKHEIVTRFQAVLAHAENLTLQVDLSQFKEARNTAQEVLHSAASLNTVVQRLGDYLEDYRFRRQPLLPLVEESIRIYEAEAINRGIEIKSPHLREATEHRFWVDVSDTHLRYALNNLIHNAVKYSFRGGPGRQRFISIVGLPEDRFYRLSIYNYGIGILPEEVERIFESGFQGQLTHGEYRTGSGRGLHFVKQIIDRHHGSISVESTLKAEADEPGHQPHINQFTIRLPYHQPRES